MANGWRPGLQIDRIDVDGDYCPENCRFVTSKENARNKRGTLMVELDGKRMSLIDAAELRGLPYAAVYQRVKKLGWPTERALSEPLR